MFTNVNSMLIKFNLAFLKFVLMSVCVCQLLSVLWHLKEIQTWAKVLCDAYVWFIFERGWNKMI
jgi:hypothetical protein